MIVEPEDRSGLHHYRSTEDIFALPTDISELQTADLAVVPREASKDNLHKNDKRGNL
jgi:hypothetical protein